MTLREFLQKLTSEEMLEQFDNLDQKLPSNSWVSFSLKFRLGDKDTIDYADILAGKATKASLINTKI